jgi:hypothetical protein
VPTDRERRLALNEAAFRIANERIRNWPERQSERDLARYYCECSHVSCHEHVMLRLSEYERVRQDSHHFVIVPGHEVVDVETVIQHNDRYSVIEKHVETHPITEATDPREDD